MVPWVTPPSFPPASIVPSTDLAKLSQNLNFLRNPPRVSLGLTAPISVIDDAPPVAVPFDYEDYDNDTMHAGGSSLVVINTAGFFDIDAWVDWEIHTGGRRYAALSITTTSGGTATLVPTNIPPCPSGDSSFTLGIVPELAVGDTVELIVFQDCGADIDLNARLQVHFRSGS